MLEGRRHRRREVPHQKGNTCQREKHSRIYFLFKKIILKPLLFCACADPDLGHAPRPQPVPGPGAFRPGEVHRGGGGKGGVAQVKRNGTFSKILIY